jgi:hypothetical protein
MLLFWATGMGKIVTFLFVEYTDIRLPAPHCFKEE